MYLGISVIKKGNTAEAMTEAYPRPSRCTEKLDKKEDSNTRKSSIYITCKEQTTINVQGYSSDSSVALLKIKSPLYTICK
jgi:hypothetical protein